ncbi:MAG: RecQ family zinc-binding domain-containing protein, partial [Moritella sp.]|uniref:RecQ family zinc-binding domain-containing protein n=1 Tax=Moritella sp. TaxID=78556 RepID=UPI001D40FF46
ILNSRFDSQQLAETLHQQFAHKEQSEIKRVHAVGQYIQSSQCLSKGLSTYFGDEKAPEQCGTCSVCQGRVAQLPLPATMPALSTQQVTELSQAFISACVKQPTPVLITRFLCGISTPLFMKMKAKKISNFAALQAYPYQQVLTLLNMPEATFFE